MRLASRMFFGRVNVADCCDVVRVTGERARFGVRSTSWGLLCPQARRAISRPRSYKFCARAGRPDVALMPDELTAKPIHERMYTGK